MRQVSLRRFRDEISVLREPVEVSRRDPSGSIQVLGFWTPYKVPVPEERAALDIPVDDERGPIIIRGAGEAAAIAATLPSGRPFPKDVQAGRKRR